MAVTIPHLSRRNGVVIGCCGAVLLAVIILGPVLQIQQKTTLDRKINDTQKKIELFKRAAELHEILQERIVDMKTSSGMQPVAPEPLSSDLADQVLEDLHALAAEAGVLLADVQPDLDSMGQDSRTMVIATTIYGTMSGFQDMLNALLEQGYVEGLKRLLVSPRSEGLQLEADFTVHIK